MMKPQSTRISNNNTNPCTLGNGGMFSVFQLDHWLLLFGFAFALHRSKIIGWKFSGLVCTSDFCTGLVICFLKSATMVASDWKHSRYGLPKSKSKSRPPGPLKRWTSWRRILLISHFYQQKVLLSSKCEKLHEQKYPCNDMFYGAKICRDKLERKLSL